MTHTSIMSPAAAKPVPVNSRFFLGAIVGLVTLSLLVLKGFTGTTTEPGTAPPSPSPAVLGTMEKASPGPEGVNHYAVVCSGFTRTRRHAKWFGDSSAWIYTLLNGKYGYPHESIWFLYDDPDRPLPREPVVVDGQMNLENFRKVIGHLAKQVRPGDSVSFFLIGHGIYRKGDSWFNSIGKDLSSTEFARLIDRLNTDDIRIVLSPCQMEGFIWKASKKGRVILSSTRFTENNSAAVAEAAIRGFENRKFDANGDGRLSFAEAYRSMVLEQSGWYMRRGAPLREHALLDDNGDGMGHYLPGESDSGDGELAAKVFLGDEGEAIRLSPRQIRDMAARNEGLDLSFRLDPYTDGRGASRAR